MWHHAGPGLKISRTVPDFFTIFNLLTSTYTKNVYIVKYIFILLAHLLRGLWRLKFLKPVILSLVRLAIHHYSCVKALDDWTCYCLTRYCEDLHQCLSLHATSLVTGTDPWLDQQVSKCWPSCSPVVSICPFALSWSAKGRKVVRINMGTKNPLRKSNQSANPRLPRRCSWWGKMQAWRTLLVREAIMCESCVVVRMDSLVGNFPPTCHPADCPMIDFGRHLPMS